MDCKDFPLFNGKNPCLSKNKWYTATNNKKKSLYTGRIMQYKLADIILFHRRQSGLTQQALAELAGVGKNLVYELESGKEGVRMENLLKVLRVLNIDLDFNSPLRQAFLKEMANADR